MPNPLETVSIVREQDNSGAVFRGLLDGLAEVAGKDGLTAKQIHDGINGDNKKAEFETLRDVFGSITDKLTGRKIGNELKKYAGRVSNGRRIIKAPARSNVVRWMVETIANATEEDSASEVRPNTSDTVGNCEQCGKPLTATLTSCGQYVNRHCEACGLDHRCIDAPDTA